MLGFPGGVNIASSTKTAAELAAARGAAEGKTGTAAIVAAAQALGAAQRAARDEHDRHRGRRRRRRRHPRLGLDPRHRPAGGGRRPRRPARPRARRRRTAARAASSTRRADARAAAPATSAASWPRAPSPWPSATIRASPSTTASRPTSWPACAAASARSTARPTSARPTRSSTAPSGTCAIAQAHIEGTAEPPPLTPNRPARCFFDVEHGLATVEIELELPGVRSVTVAVCAEDAVRLTRGEEPHVGTGLGAPPRRPLGRPPRSGSAAGAGTPTISPRCASTGARSSAGRSAARRPPRTTTSPRASTITSATSSPARPQRARRPVRRRSAGRTIHRPTPGSTGRLTVRARRGPGDTMARVAAATEAPVAPPPRTLVQRLLPRGLWHFLRPARDLRRADAALRADARVRAGRHGRGLRARARRDPGRARPRDLPSSSTCRAGRWTRAGLRHGASRTGRTSTASSRSRSAFLLWVYCRRNYACYFVRNVIIATTSSASSGYIIYPHGAAAHAPRARLRRHAREQRP